MKAQQIYNKFIAMPDGQHIATLGNIEKVIEICKDALVVVEMGGGIGALSYAILTNSNAYLYIYEEDAHCQNRLRENLTGFEGRYEIITNYHTLPRTQRADVLIIDGGNHELHGPEWHLATYLKGLKTVYIEGFRRKQYKNVSEGLRLNYTFETRRRNLPNKDATKHTKSREEEKGGTLILCKEEPNAIKRNLAYLHQRLQENRRTGWIYRPLVRSKYLKNNE